MHELILRLWRETGMTVFMVTHDIGEAFKLGTRILTFDKVRRDPQAPEHTGPRSPMIFRATTARNRPQQSAVAHDAARQAAIAGRLPATRLAPPITRATRS